MSIYENETQLRGLIESIINSKDVFLNQNDKAVTLVDEEKDLLISSLQLALKEVAETNLMFDEHDIKCFECGKTIKRYDAMVRNMVDSKEGTIPAEICMECDEKFNNL